jgi:hypothetical protein
MFRSTFLVFIAGWITWFWIDKPRGGPRALPPAGDSLVGNFQQAFDILKAGQPKLAFVYIWSAHYIVISLLGGILLTGAYNGIAGYLARRRMRGHFAPPPARPATPAEKPAAPQAPPGED